MPVCVSVCLCVLPYLACRGLNKCYSVNFHNDFAKLACMIQKGSDNKVVASFSISWLTEWTILDYNIIVI